LARSPFSLARLIRITPAGKVLYKAEKDRCQRYPPPASEDLFGGVARNYQVFEPLDFLAELTQHIPNKGEHLIRYYGHYSNKTRGLRAKNAAACPAGPDTPPGRDPPAQPPIGEPARLNRRRWAALIKHIYQADPLLCPKCGGTMKVIAFIEAHQGDVIRKILEHCGLWHDPPPRAPPCAAPPYRAVRAIAESDSDPGTLDSPPRAKPAARMGGSSRFAGGGVSRGITHEVDPDFLEHLRREAIEQPDLPWEP
jgi:hypothetical protein